MADGSSKRRPVLTDLVNQIIDNLRDLRDQVPCMSARMKIGPKMTETRSLIGPKMAETRSLIGPKMAETRSLIGLKMAETRSLIGPKMAETRSLIESFREAAARDSDKILNPMQQHELLRNIHAMDSMLRQIIQQSTNGTWLDLTRDLDQLIKCLEQINRSINAWFSRVELQRSTSTLLDTILFEIDKESESWSPRSDMDLQRFKIELTFSDLDSDSYRLYESLTEHLISGAYGGRLEDDAITVLLSFVNHLTKVASVFSRSTHRNKQCHDLEDLCSRLTSVLPQFFNCLHGVMECDTYQLDPLHEYGVKLTNALYLLENKMDDELIRWNPVAYKLLDNNGMLVDEQSGEMKKQVMSLVEVLLLVDQLHGTQTVVEHRLDVEELNNLISELHSLFQSNGSVNQSSVSHRMPRSKEIEMLVRDWTSQMYHLTNVIQHHCAQHHCSDADGSLSEQKLQYIRNEVGSITHVVENDASLHSHVLTKAKSTSSELTNLCHELTETLQASQSNFMAEQKAQLLALLCIKKIEEFGSLMKMSTAFEGHLERTPTDQSSHSQEKQSPMTPSVGNSSTVCDTKQLNSTGRKINFENLPHDAIGTPESDDHLTEEHCGDKKRHPSSVLNHRSLHLKQVSKDRVVDSNSGNRWNTSGPVNISEPGPRVNKWITPGTEQPINTRMYAGSGSHVNSWHGAGSGLHGSETSDPPTWYDDDDNILRKTIKEMSSMTLQIMTFTRSVDEQQPNKVINHIVGLVKCLQNSNKVLIKTSDVLIRHSVNKNAGDELTSCTQHVQSLLAQLNILVCVKLATHNINVTSDKTLPALIKQLQDCLKTLVKCLKVICMKGLVRPSPEHLEEMKTFIMMEKWRNHLSSVPDHRYNGRNEIGLKRVNLNTSGT